MMTNLVELADMGRVACYLQKFACCFHGHDLLEQKWLGCIRPQLSVPTYLMLAPAELLVDRFPILGMFPAVL